MPRIALLLVYESEAGRKPLPICRLRGAALLADAAAAAISEAEERVKRVASLDPVLGEIERAEVNKLREILSIVFPTVQ